MLKNILKHTKLVLQHKWLVFRFCCKIGMPFRGIIHDMSKFSWTEFGESIKYYRGEKSPIEGARDEKGYSLAWYHHRGKNKHHEQYWVDFDSPVIAPVIPYKYVAEMICDKLSANITYTKYKGKKWEPSMQYEYWEKEKTKRILNPKVANFITEVFRQVRDEGLDKTLNKKNMKNLYKKYCIDDETNYVYEYEFHGQWKKEN